MIPVILTLDVCLTVYQILSFHVLGLEPVERRRYIVIDRHRLSKLSPIEKFGCVYCGYANGVIAWAREIAACTEAFWCPIQHWHTPESVHGLYDGFLPYGELSAWRDDPWELGFASGGLSEWPGTWNS